LESVPSNLADVVTCGYTDLMIANVRTTKARLSELLERAAAGEEIVITSDGRPKARLVGIELVRTPYRVNRRLLAVAPRKADSAAERMIRRDRDGRD
jgi:prevent-host-death family protein